MTEVRGLLWALAVVGAIGCSGDRTVTSSGLPSSRQLPGSHDMLFIRRRNGLPPHDA